MSHDLSRRRFVQLVAGTGIASHALADAASADSDAAAPGSGASIADAGFRLEFDPVMRSRVVQVRESGAGIALTAWSDTEYLVLADKSRIDHFRLKERRREALQDAHGKGTRLTLTGASHDIEKTVRVELHERYPGFAFYRVSYRNSSARSVALAGWHSCDTQLLSGSESAEPKFWSYCGSTHEDRRDWVQPVRPGFAQDNFMGMTASDYGGGTPVVDVWRRDAGLAVGHLERVPKLLSLPLTRTGAGAKLSIAGVLTRQLAPGETFDTPETFLAVHTGDYFRTLDAYRRIMGERGLMAPRAPQDAYEGIWCAWGYERSCTPKLILDTLPKVKELGLKWGGLDDGGQTHHGAGRPDPGKFPRGAVDMQGLVQDIRRQSLKPRLWVAPLAAAPGSDLLHDHTDMLLLDKEGAPQMVSWWNSFYLCPAYPKTVDYTVAMVQRFIKEWGFAGLKIDGQHLNGVAPCYNPAHKHARPEESVEKLQDFLHAMYAAAMQINHECVMELCPCGTAYSFFNFASFNQAPASDPESSWQVRLKGKTMKALMGPNAAFAGDHVELSDGGDDFASTVGVGAIVSTKFTWPKDPKPKDSFLLTPQREALWRKWIALYNERMLPQGNYRGELYDLGFDKPEAHAVEKGGRMYYAFYAKTWQGPVTLRGLKAGRYRVRDYFNDKDLGEVTAQGGPLALAFERFMVLEAIPV
jgi:alpha-galactosidase